MCAMGLLRILLWAGTGVPSSPPNTGGGSSQEDVEDPCNPSGPAQIPPPECMSPCE